MTGGRPARMVAFLALVPLIAAAPTGTPGAVAPGPDSAPGEERTAPAPGVAATSPADSPYYAFALRPPGRVRGGASGSVDVVFPESPFNVAVTAAGHYVLDLRVTTRALRAPPGAGHVAWVAAPSLDPVQKLGVIEGDEPVRGRVDFDNKFLVFVTVEPDPGVERPTGRIVLQGVSRSGRMESMFAHGFCPPGEYC